MVALLVKNPPGSAGGVSDLGLILGSPWIRNISWRKKWQPTPVFLPGKSHG